MYSKVVFLIFGFIAAGLTGYALAKLNEKPSAILLLTFLFGFFVTVAHIFCYFLL